MKHQALFLQKIKVKIIKVSSVAILFGTLRVKEDLQSLFIITVNNDSWFDKTFLLRHKLFMKF